VRRLATSAAEVGGHGCRKYIVFDFKKAVFQLGHQTVILT
jgi:hypothetical protein